MHHADKYLTIFYHYIDAGAGQKSAMFVHAQSFEDLMAEDEEDARGDDELDKSEGEHAEEELKVLEGEEDIDEPPNNARPLESRPKEEDVSSEAWRSHRKHVFVLSEAGKPIYTRYGTEEALSSTVGVMVALVSFVEAEKNIIRSIHAGQNIGYIHTTMFSFENLKQSLSTWLFWFRISFRPRTY